MLTCEYCLGQMRVVRSIYNEEDEEFYRTKRCDGCGHEIYTVEFEIEDNIAFRRTWNECWRKYNESHPKERKRKNAKR